MNWPTTLEDAAKRVLDILEADDSKMTFSKMTKGGLIMLHPTLGRYIRNEFGLWLNNEELLKSCGKDHPDDASLVIIKRAWELTQQEL